MKLVAEAPYTLIKTKAPNSILHGTPTLVNGGTPARVISDKQLEGLIPEVLTWMIVPK